MGSKLLELITHDDLRRRLGAMARQTIENNWTWDIQGTRLAQVLQMAQDRRKSAPS
jgi:glycosyltransferase involved in cell wall biosynthesis